MPPPPPDTDVVIVTADTRDMTLRCIRQVLATMLPAELVVVDNGSTDGTAEAIAEMFGARVDVLALDEPVGFAEACNAGAARGTAPVVLFLNSDILVVEESTARLRASLERPGAVAAGGRLVDPVTLETQMQYLPRRFPGLLEFAVILLGIEKRWPHNPVTRRYHGVNVDMGAGPQSSQQPAAAALMVYRSTFEEVGGFDERFWFWFEDSDLLLRLSHHGEIVFDPDAVFRHEGGGTFTRWDRSRRIRSMHHGMVRFAEAHFGHASRRVLGALLILVAMPRLAARRRDRAEADAWRAVASAGSALLLGRPTNSLVAERAAGDLGSAPMPGAQTDPSQRTSAVAGVATRFTSAARLRPVFRALARPTYSRTLAYVPDREELAEVLNRRGLTGTAVEIGVQEGVFSRRLLTRWRGRLLISVDPWLAAPRQEWDNTDNVPQDLHERLYSSTVKTLRGFGGRSQIWRMTGAEAGAGVARRTLDFVFIDARHDYASVLDDVSTWFEKVRDGGLIAGHDYGDGLLPEGDFGVKRAVDEFFGPRGLEVLTCFNERYLPSWVVCVRH